MVLFGNYGLGMKYQLMDSLALKFDVRHLINFNHGDNTMLYTLGLAVPFGERTKATPVVAPAPVAKPVAPIEVDKDSDSDGVLDKLDKCPVLQKVQKLTLLDVLH